MIRSTQAKGPSLTKGSGGGVVVPATYPGWLKFTVTANDLSIAATSNSILLYTLPAGSQIHAVKLKHSLIFSGVGITSYMLSIGLIGDVQRYQSYFAVSGPVASSNLIVTNILDCQDQGLTTSIQVSALSTGGNLNAPSITGSADIWLLVSNAT
jgi:hypothetical protein